MRYGLVGLIGFALLLGCKMLPKSSFQGSQGGDITFADLKPDASPGDKAVLVLGGVNVPVKVIRTVKGNEIRLDLQAHDVIFESEVYTDDPNQFGLKDAGDETFDPPIPLLKSPMKLGDQWSWSGSMFNGVARSAQAVVTSKLDKVYGGGHQEDALRVDVKLSMDSGTKTPAERTLVFFFVKDRGVLKREVGSGSTRVPEKPE